MTTAGVRTAVLRPALRARHGRLLAAIPHPASLLRSALPSAAMFAGAAVLLAGGALPVIDS